MQRYPNNWVSLPWNDHRGYTTPGTLYFVPVKFKIQVPEGILRSYTLTLGEFAFCSILESNISLG